VIKPAEAIRDFKFITELNNLPEIFASNKRISLANAFPDLETPQKGAKNHPYDTTYRTLQKATTQKKDGVREFLRKNLPNRLSWTDSERRACRSEYSAGKPPEIYSPFLDSVARFIIGMLGGCALIVPIVVMALHGSLVKSLVTVSIAVVLFALVFGILFQAENMETVVATATYAAVLVVFVGTSGGSGGAAGGS
jgi:hypothetical protein